MLLKVGKILFNFLKAIKKREFFELIVLPLIITIFLFIFCKKSIVDFDDFVSRFNGTIISVTSILGAFSLAALTIIVTSSNENIERAKNTQTKRKDKNGGYLSYYKLQILRNFFSLIVLFGLLIYSIIFTFIKETIGDTTIIFYSEVYLLILAIFSQIFLIQSMYYLFIEVRPQNQD